MLACAAEMREVAALLRGYVESGRPGATVEDHCLGALVIFRRLEAGLARSASSVARGAVSLRRRQHLQQSGGAPAAMPANRPVERRRSASEQ